MRPMLSVVVPTLGTNVLFQKMLASLDEAREAGLELDLIVADGGSIDDSLKRADQAGARIVTASPGRGQQLAAGADVARGDWLLFLHADTVLASGWTAPAQTFLADPGNAERAAYFRYALDATGPAARRLERLVAWRSRVLGLPYGDQGLLMATPFYRDLGGFRAMPLMEDVDLVRRIGRRRLVSLDCPAVTSAARYVQGGYLLRPVRNLTCLALYFLGLPSRWLQRLYG